MIVYKLLAFDRNVYIYNCGQIIFIGSIWYHINVYDVLNTKFNF